MKGDLSKKLPSFWIPELVPSSKTKSKIEKPVNSSRLLFIYWFFLVLYLRWYLKDNKIYCPMSKNPISMKDLIEVKFKRLAESESLDRKSLIARTERYVCAVTNDVLGNSVQCVVLRTSWVLGLTIFLSYIRRKYVKIFLFYLFFLIEELWWLRNVLRRSSKKTWSIR